LPRPGGRLETAKLAQHVAPEELDRRRVVRVGGADDDVLDARLGEPAEALDDLIRRLRRRAHALRPDGLTGWRFVRSISAKSRPTSAQCSARIAYFGVS
jgi:hypothetical protein